MRSIEDKGSPSLEFQKKAGGGRGGGGGGLGKPSHPSKWDDAQKWLVNLSKAIDKSSDQPRDSNADDTRLIAPPPFPNPTTDFELELDEALIETKKVDFGDHSVYNVRDMGTEMTPIPSQEPSRSATPVRATTPPMASASSPTPATPTPSPTVETTRFGQETEGEQDVVETQNRNQPPTQHSNLNPLETRALAWDDAERAKYMARFKREEVKIEAWENHEKRKADMEMKRMEAKAERLKARAQEKYMNKVASTRRIAEEKRAKAEAVLNEKAVKTCERADYIRRTGHLPSSFSIIKLPWCCW